jgi:anti-anti-sigma factor
MSALAREYRLQVEVQGPVTRVTFVCPDGRLHEGTVQALGKELLAVAETVAGGTLWLSLAGVVYLTSTTLEVLLSLRRRVRDAGGRLILSDLGPAVQEVFQITRLDKIFEVHSLKGSLSLSHGSGGK